MNAERLDALEEQSNAAIDIERALKLLKAASLLLGRGGPLQGVQVLHTEVRRASCLLDPGAPQREYASRRDAEETHRQLLVELTSKHIPSPTGSWLQSLRRRLPQWASWVTICVVVTALTVRYAYAVLSRANWQSQHPDGNWISRYYKSSAFEGFPLVRYDVGVSYNWGMGAPADAMARDDWSARWDTCVLVRSDVELMLHLLADDAGQLLVDDATVLDSRRKEQQAAVTLRQGVRHLRVDFQDRHGGAKLRLEGLNLDGTDAYTFQRPVFVGQDVHCQ